MALTRLTLLFLLVGTALLSFAQPAPPGDLTGKSLRDWYKINWYTPYAAISSSESSGYQNARIRLYNYIDNRATENMLECVYSGYSMSFTYGGTESNPGSGLVNCEHTVPQSYFKDITDAGSVGIMKNDLHHLYPAYRDWNSTRNNHPFGEIEDTTTTKWMINSTATTSIPGSDIDAYAEYTNVPANYFEPREEHKGNVARSVLYFYTMYEDYSGISPVTAVIDDINTLYEWHLADPVDERERERNDLVAAYQGNRNPYVDYPESLAIAWDFESPCTAAPSIQITSLTASAIDYQQASISWTNGDGNARLIVVRQGSAVSLTPSGTYTANADFSSAAADAGGNKVVYTGSGNAFTLSGLEENTLYHVQAFEYCSTTEEYLLTSAPVTSFTTPSCAEPTLAASSLSVRSESAGSLSVSWTSGNGQGRLVLAKEGNAVDTSPTDGTAYTASAGFGLGDELGSGNFVVYAGTGSAVLVEGLTEGTDYHFAVYEYNCTAEDYLLTNAPIASGTPASANAWQISSLNTSYTIDFDNAVANVNPAQYDGSGFSASPANGQLDSDSWVISGLSDGSLAYGESQSGNDFGRGNSSGGVSTGGLYAFEVATGNYALGIQPTGSDFTPGSISLKFTNTTGKTIKDLSLQYRVWINDNEGRSNSFTFSHSADGAIFTSENSLDLSSAETGVSGWQVNLLSLDLTDLNLAADASYYLRWTLEDISGSGSRDEFALDDIQLTAYGASTESILISQYYEGSSNNKWIEITNVGDSDYDGSTPLYLALFSNPVADDLTGVSPSNTQLLPALTAGQSILFRNSAAADPAYALSGDETSSSTINFNGDDIILLTTATGTSAYADRTDIIGTASNWGTDRSFYRAGAITAGNTTYTATEWIELTTAEVASAAAGETAYLGYHSGPSTLPVTLLRFTATVHPMGITLDWLTAGEINNAGFDLQRSENGTAYTSIAWLEAPTPTNEGHAYRFTDYNLPENAAYYRLQQQDTDGATTLYGPIYVENPYRAGQQEIKVWPNPGKDRLNVWLPYTPVGEVTLKVYAAHTGELLHIRQSWNTLQTQLKNGLLADLPTGVYQLQFSANQQQHSIRWIKY